MKKILHLITSLEGGGTENFLYQILERSPAGYAHRVVYLKKDGVMGNRIRQLQIPVTRAGGLWSLTRLLRQESPAILHTCLYSAHIVGRCLGRWRHVPAIITSQRAIDIWQNPIQTLVDRWTLPFCDAVMVNSHAAAVVIEKRRGLRESPRIFEIPNGVDPQRFQRADKTAARRRFGLPANAVVGGTLMRLHREKGADFIPEFARRLLPANPSLHLFIGGVGPLEHRIKKSLARTGLDGRVHWAGWQENAPEFLSACDFFWSLSREESFPQTLVEASSIGLPWVAPETGGVPELLRSGAVGLTYRRLDIASAARKTADLIQDLAPLISTAGLVASQIQGDYSLEKMTNRVYEVFNRF